MGGHRHWPGSLGGKGQDWDVWLGMDMGCWVEKGILTAFLMALIRIGMLGGHGLLDEYGHLDRIFNM